MSQGHQFVGENMCKGVREETRCQWRREFVVPRTGGSISSIHRRKKDIMNL